VAGKRSGAANFLERAVILSPDSILRAHIAELAPLEQIPQALPAASALDQSNWVVGGRNGAAALLGLKRTSLVYRMQRLGISRVDPADGSQS
jgi:formate hydrogenlyase transcriptional activator